MTGLMKAFEVDYHINFDLFFCFFYFQVAHLNINLSHDATLGTAIWGSEQHKCLDELLCERALLELNPSRICKCHISDAFKTQIVTNGTL